MKKNNCPSALFPVPITLSEDQSIELRFEWTLIFLFTPNSARLAFMRGDKVGLKSFGIFEGIFSSFQNPPSALILLFDKLQVYITWKLRF